MVQELSSAQWMALTWFAAAVLLEVVTTIGFAQWLRRKGTALIFGFIGIPGYLEYLYAEWCRANGRDPLWMIVLRLLLLVNVVGAFIVAMPIFETA